MGFPLAAMAGNRGFSVAHDETYVDVSGDDETELRRWIPPEWFMNILIPVDAWSSADGLNSL
jgi:hypothetical protein